MADLSGMFRDLNSTINQHPLAQQYDASVPGMAPSPMDKINPLLRNMLQGGTRALGGTGDFATSQEKQSTANATYGEAVTNQDPKALRAAAGILVKQGRIAEAQQALAMADQIQQKRNALLDKEQEVIDAQTEKAKLQGMAMKLSMNVKDPSLKEGLRSGAIDPKEYIKASYEAKLKQKPVVVAEGSLVIMPDGSTQKNEKVDKLETKVLTGKEGSPDRLINSKTGAVIATFGEEGSSDEKMVGIVSKLGGVRSHIQNAQKMYKASPNLAGGVGSAVFGSYPTTEAKSLLNAVKTIQANLGFDALTELKKNGGTLGQIAVAELEALKSTLETLDPQDSRFGEQLERLDKAYGIAIDIAAGNNPIDAIDWSNPVYDGIRTTVGGDTYVRLDGKNYKLKNKGGK
jgi:hypothetical protein